MNSLRHFSPREAQLIDLISQAKTNKEIAAELQLSTGTVAQYLADLYASLGIHSRAELALWARKNAGRIYPLKAA